MRDELEHLLDDDEDMAEMYLTEKLTLTDIENSAVTLMNDHDDANEQVQPETDERYNEVWDEHGGAEVYLSQHLKFWQASYHWLLHLSLSSVL